MRRFECRQLSESLAHAAAGGQALHLHLHRILGPSAPACFFRAIERGEDLAHLFDQDEARLVATARTLGVRVIVVEHRGTPRQHIDLCSGPLRRALALCDAPASPCEEGGN